MSVISVTDIEALKLEKLSRLCLSDFRVFCRVFWVVLNPGDELNWHRGLEAIALHLQALYEGRIRRLGVAIPPGTGKSTIVSILFPLWCWCKNPTLRFISSTHSLELSYIFNSKRLQVINSERFQLVMRPKWKVDSSTSANKGRLQNTMMGEIIATAVGAKVTGKHCHIFLLDDLLTPLEARTSLRHKPMKYWDDTLRSRTVHKKNPMLVNVAQRLSVDDPHGVFRRRGVFDAEVVLPAIYDSKIDPGPTPIGWYDDRKQGELLSEEYMDLESCE